MIILFSLTVGAAAASHNHDDRYYTESELTGSSTTVVVAKASSATTAASASAVAWNGVTSKPETATRWPSWSEVTSKPETFTPSTHNHDDRYYTESELTGSSTTVVVAKAASATTAASANAVAWNNVSDKPSSYTPSAHNQASNTINSMSGYSVASASGAVLTNDTLNQAIGKLEKRLQLLEAAVGGMKFVKLTSQEYTELTVKDDNTLYIIND